MFPLKTKGEQKMRKHRKMARIKNEPLFRECKAVLERGVGAALPDSAVVEAALKDLRRRLKGDLVQFDQALEAIQVIAKRRIEMTLSAFLSESQKTPDGHRRAVACEYDQTAGRIAIRVGDEPAYYVWVASPNDEFGFALSELEQEKLPNFEDPQNDE